MTTIAVTGSAGGIGGAIRARIEGAGHDVLGVDVRDAEGVADLLRGRSDPEATGRVVGRVTQLTGLDPAAGHSPAPPPLDQSPHAGRGVEATRGDGCGVVW